MTLHPAISPIAPALFFAASRYQRDRDDVLARDPHERRRPPLRRTRRPPATSVHPSMPRALIFGNLSLRQPLILAQLP